MDWQGIPFKFLGEDPLQQAFLSVSHLPNIIVKTDFALDTFLSGLVAGIIPAVVAYLAMRSNAKSIRDERLHQEKLSSITITKQIVSASRQVWINELRDSTAKYIGVASSVTNCLNIMIGERYHHAAETPLYARMHEEQRVGKAELGVLKTKVELLLNPDEESSKRVYKALEDIRKEIVNKNRPKNKNIEFNALRPLYAELRLSVQDVIKTEWNKLKDV
ncbi:hypothetical protein [Serratia marcescens]|uniref:hypothetical protein n=1 Tax=Serratia marcescens TaxID=615 RepID=UPI0027E5B23B|nr:hypothetical protein [Serratia marcescens]